MTALIIVAIPVALLEALFIFAASISVKVNKFGSGIE
jgi:hypothetical protein